MRPAAAAPSRFSDASYGHTVPDKHRLSPKLAKMRKLLRPKLLKTPDEADLWNRGEADKEQVISGRLRQMLEALAAQSPEYRVTGDEFAALNEALLDDILGFGAIHPLVVDRTVSEIMVNGPEIIFKEQKGKLLESEYVFDDEDHVLWTAQRIVRPLGRTLDR